MRCDRAVALAILLAVADPTDPMPAPSWVRWLQRGGGVLAIGLVAAFLCHELLVSVFVVTGVSMEPTLHDGQRVLVLKHVGALARGDLIVFRSPTAPDQFLLKRVLGLPNEDLLSERGQLYVGAPSSARRFAMAEPYLTPTAHDETRLAPVHVPPTHYFVLGDNRGESVDSRAFGTIDQDLVVGRVVYPCGE